MLLISSHKGNGNQKLTKIPLTLLTTPLTTGVGQDVGKKEPSYTSGRNANWCNYSGKKFGGFLKI
jgi:hypothetical protein